VLHECLLDVLEISLKIKYLESQKILGIFSCFNKNKHIINALIILIIQSMKLLKGFIFIIIFIFGFSFSNTQAHAANPFPKLETQIHSWSTAKKIRKIQFALKGFWIYTWKIDGNYKSVEKEFLAYQKKAGLIKNNYDYGAWYFWVKTLKSLRENYPNKFEKITKKYLLMDEPAKHTRYFYITAYYSPLLWQRRYSYNIRTRNYRNYSQEIRLQWEWKLTASKKKVFTWVLAWPRNYIYGTKIEFEWLWVGVIEDRWWAIVNSWERWYEYDRIDVWMWYGYEWLLRAEKWWKRKVMWKVVPNTREISIEFDESPVIKYANFNLNGDNPKTQNVLKLQSLLKEVKIYAWPVDWKYNSVKKDFIKYQVDNNVVNSKKSPYAWFFWKKTYAALRQDFWWGIFKNKNNKLDEDIILSTDIKIWLEKVKNKISGIIEDKYWSNNSPLAIVYRNNLRKILDKYANKSKNKLKKKKLKYLKSII